MLGRLLLWKLRRQTQSAAAKLLQISEDMPLPSQPDARRHVKWRNPSAYTVWTSPAVYRVCWFGFLIFHAACGAHYAAAALMYKEIHGSLFGYNLEILAIGLGRSNDSLLAGIMTFLAALHCLAILAMAMCSLMHRRFVYWIPDSELPRPKALRVATEAPSELRQLRCLLRLSFIIFGRTGFFGIENPQFVTLFLVQELIQAILRAHQASILAMFVPELQIVRLFVGLVFLQCWFIPVVHRMCGNAPGHERLCYILSDITMGFITTILIPTMLAVPFAKQYDVNVKNFPTYLYELSDWYALMISDFQRIIVTSWLDLFARIVMAVSILISVQDAKILLRAEESKIHAAVSTIKTLSVYPTSPTSVDLARSPVISPHRLKRLFHSALNAMIMGVGVVVLVLHIRAEARGDVESCVLPVRPWTSSRPGCAFLLINCTMNRIHGSTDEMVEILSNVDAHSLQVFNVASCPRLQMPPIIQDFRHLATIRLIRSRVIDWGTEAALTAEYHPRVTAVTMHHVEMPDGTLPPGLLCPRFPPNLRMIQLYSTNVMVLPPTLSSVWPMGMLFLYEFNGLTKVPEVIFKMSFLVLSLAGNQLTEYPPEGLYLPWMMYLDLSGNPLTTLPEVPAAAVKQLGLPPVGAIDLSATKLQYLPSWSTGLRPRVLGAHTPLCSRIVAGEPTNVTVDCTTWDGVGQGKMG
ncbi:hypothetical protein Poli38472_000359 [Pythium oligandrum]|uniref:Uncharacterized protein n=1 Tax=Pythium oligandrum TaxID=41045 RepID=A0A8K1FI11_PYTOL|nr:hypothetical protein Poli38472_000359 [Pythium oligandrum]|eukprot:TMW60317.1 hypothetical protein Poli38472_000359 [Pythium oligandrum]